MCMHMQSVGQWSSCVLCVCKEEQQQTAEQIFSVVELCEEMFRQLATIY